MSLAEKPELQKHLAHYFEAFTILTVSRAAYQGCVGYIPLSEIHAYFQMFGITDIEEKQDYLYLIRALDEEYIGYLNKKSEQWTTPS